MRVTRSDAKLPAVERGRPLTVLVNGEPTTAFDGETISTVLLVEGRLGFRRTAQTGEYRGLFCGMGICYDCVVTVDGVHNVRACVTPVRDGMSIQVAAENDR